MTPAPRGAGLVGRAIVLALLTALIAALLLALAQRPEVSQELRRLGWSIGYEARMIGAALLTALLGAGLAALFFGGSERVIRDALLALDGPGERPTGEDGLKTLAGALQDWRHRVRAAEAARERLEAAARGLTGTLDTTAREIGGAWIGHPAGADAQKPAEYEDEALRGLAAAAQEAGAAARRIRGVMTALLARVAEDLAGVDEPLAPAQETLAGMGRVIEDLVATYPALPALPALQAALDDCGADVTRARQAAELVARELNAVRRRMGGGAVEMQTAREPLSRVDERTREGMD